MQLWDASRSRLGTWHLKHLGFHLCGFTRGSHIQQSEHSTKHSRSNLSSTFYPKLHQPLEHSLLGYCIFQTLLAPFDLHGNHIALFLVWARELTKGHISFMMEKVIIWHGQDWDAMEGEGSNMSKLQQDMTYLRQSHPQSALLTHTPYIQTISPNLSFDPNL